MAAVGHGLPPSAFLLTTHDNNLSLDFNLEFSDGFDFSGLDRLPFEDPWLEGPSLADTLHNYSFPALECERQDDSLSQTSSTMKPKGSRTPAEKIAGKRRSRFPETAVTALENSFILEPYPDDLEVSSIAKSAKLKAQQVKTWFSNKRSRTKHPGPVAEGTSDLNHLPLTRTSLESLPSVKDQDDDQNAAVLKFLDIPPKSNISQPNLSSSWTPSKLLNSCVEPSNGDELILTALVIKNIPFAVKKEQLVQVMINMNLPLPYALNYHFDRGVFRGLGFANFSSPEEAAAALDALNQYEINGRKLRVEYKDMLPLAEQERIEREKQARRSQLHEQYPDSKRPYGSGSHSSPPSPPMQSFLHENSKAYDIDFNDPAVLELYAQLLAFKEDYARSSLALPPTLSPAERRIVHTLAHQMGLAHFSSGIGDERAVYVFRKMTDSASLRNAPQPSHATIKSSYSTIKPSYSTIRPGNTANDFCEFQSSWEDRPTFSRPGSIAGSMESGGSARGSIGSMRSYASVNSRTSRRGRRQWGRELAGLGRNPLSTVARTRPTPSRSPRSPWHSSIESVVEPSTPPKISSEHDLPLLLEPMSEEMDLTSELPSQWLDDDTMQLDWVGDRNAELTAVLLESPSGPLSPLPTRKTQFYCTFCAKQFSSRYTWNRHEESVHVPRAVWICNRTLANVEKPTHCLFCPAMRNEMVNGVTHGEKHVHFACSEKPEADRTFFRKDNLLQHLRHTHQVGAINTELNKTIDHWKAKAPPLDSKDPRLRCLFCGTTSASWEKRVDHMAKHFKEMDKEEVCRLVREHCGVIQ